MTCPNRHDPVVCRDLRCYLGNTCNDPMREDKRMLWADRATEPSSRRPIIAPSLVTSCATATMYREAGLPRDVRDTYIGLLESAIASFKQANEAALLDARAVISSARTDKP